MQEKRQKLLSAVAQPQHTAEDPADEAEDADVELPSDLEAAIMFLRNEFRLQCPSLPPLVLHTQLCSMISDRTSADRGIEECRRKNKLRVFKLATGADEHGIMLLDDYVRCVLEAAEPRQAQATNRESAEDAGPQQPGEGEDISQQEQQEQQQRQEAHQQEAWASARNFCLNVVLSHADVSISRARVRELLARSCSGASDPQDAHLQHQQQEPLQPLQPALTPSELSVLEGLDTDKQVSLLLNLGALSRHPVDDQALLLNVPGLGPVIKGINAGRAELLRIVSKKQYKEMLESQILGATASTTAGSKRSASGARKATQGVKLRSSCLGTAFHLRDLLGKGWLQRVHTAAGCYIRAVKD